MLTKKEIEFLQWLCNEYINNGIADINNDEQETIKLIEKLNSILIKEK